MYRRQVSGRELLSIFEGFHPGGDLGADRVERVISETSGFWTLCRIPLSRFPDVSGSIEGASSQRRIKKYLKLSKSNLNDMPPVILIDEGHGIEIVDGFHRIGLLQLHGEELGSESVLAYVSGVETGLRFEARGEGELFTGDSVDNLCYDMKASLKIKSLFISGQGQVTAQCAGDVQKSYQISLFDESGPLSLSDSEVEEICEDLLAANTFC
ncbi:MAG: hypothetical protein EOP06_01095 [Proteobacteria bacterium]|nr:MAG: hypothetical protein EOP06_01095 [Pseudomonadota bacterium]